MHWVAAIFFFFLVWKVYIWVYWSNILNIREINQSTLKKSFNCSVNNYLKLSIFVYVFVFLCLYIWVCFPSCAAQFTDGSQYSVLLMITDGVISDMVQTKEAVVNVSKHTHTYRERERERGRQPFCNSIEAHKQRLRYEPTLLITVFVGQAASLPLSIIIVGVGPAEFDGMYYTLHLCLFISTESISFIWYQVKQSLVL